LADNENSFAHATFTASLAPGQSIKYHADGGMRIVLDIPASDEADADALRAWRDKLLMVTIAPVEEHERPAATHSYL
jgi:hypothetical protein